MNKKWINRSLIISISLSMILLSGCQNTEQLDATDQTDSLSTQEQTLEEGADEDKDIDDSISEGSEVTSEDMNGSADSKEEDELSSDNIIEDKKAMTDEELKAMGINELGEIMVIMYHNLAEENSTYGRTVESFKGDLQRLYDMNFRLISMTDFITGNIDVPAGYTPVVLTFDDGHITNFNMIEKDGEMIIDPNCTVGILEEFYKTHPDFGLEATFYLNGYAFGQSEHLEYKLQYLMDRGFEIQNHTIGHENLANASKEGIEKALGGNIKYYQEINPNIQMNSLALPFGAYPDDAARREAIRKGSYEGYGYENLAILAVGWKPSVSPMDKSYNPEYVMRVQSGDANMQLTWWLDNYEAAPGARFYSDGNPSTVTIPNSKYNQLNEEAVGNHEVIVYE